MPLPQPWGGKHKWSKSHRVPSKLGGGCEVDSLGKKAGKGALIQWEMSGTLGVSQDQTLFVWVSTSTTNAPRGVSKTLNNRATDADHVPCVLIRGGLASARTPKGKCE